MGRRPTIFTPEVYAKIPTWVEQGLTPEAIAERIGSTVGSLKTRCAEQRIRLRPGTQQQKVIFADTSRMLIHVPLSRPALQSIRNEAAKRDLAADALAGLILETIANENLFAAVMDDDT